MKKNIILAIVGIFFMLGLVGCPVAETSSFNGTWKITGGAYYDTLKEEKEPEADGNFYMIFHDGKYMESWSGLTYEITENTCNSIKTTDIYNYTYEIAGDTMSWKLNTGTILDLAGTWYVMEKVSD